MIHHSILTYLQAGYAGLALLTPEEARAEAEVAAAAAQLDRRLHAWSSTEGLCDLSSGAIQPCSDPLEALHQLESLFVAEQPRHVVLMRDLHLYFDQSDPLLIRRLRDLLKLAKTGGHAVVLAGCRLKLPPELEHEIAAIELPLPGREQLAAVAAGILESAQLPPLTEGASSDAILGAASGLTTIEAENAFALSIVHCGRLDPLRIAAEKARAIRQSGLLEVIDRPASLDDIGGLDGLKAWLLRRVSSFDRSARDYGLPAPKGLLIAGIPGTGKSLTAKATAGALGLPLLRLDVGRLFGGLVGQSEANLRSVIRTVEAIAPCVLWIDEIEKGFGGSSGAGGDGGTSVRVFGSFLSWMQEKQSPVFVVATANDVAKLPPEFLRKGRFDELFFVDLPSRSERERIWSIIIARSQRLPGDYSLASFAGDSDGFTGAEIEGAWNEALHEAFAAGREPENADVQSAIAQTVPLSRLMPEKLNALRTWSQGRTRCAATILATLPVAAKGPRRKVTPLN